MVTPGSNLDTAFNALANPTRRQVVSRLCRGPARVTELAKPFDMALPSFMQHIQILEESGLITTRKSGRVRVVRIRRQQINRVATWLDKQRQAWEQRLNQLDDYVGNMEDL